MEFAPFVASGSMLRTLLHFQSSLEVSKAKGLKLSCACVIVGLSSTGSMRHSSPVRSRGAQISGSEMALDGSL